MRLTFDPDFDSGAWRGSLPAGHATAGEAWVGPLGFLNILETELGLGAPSSSHADRVAALVPRLFQRDRFYGPSARVDPWGTAQQLLAWRDQLWEDGWRGEGLEQRRLIELAEVTISLPAGAAERLELVAGRLAGRSTSVAEVRLLIDESCFSQVWRNVLSALSKSGAKVYRESLHDAPAAGNLLALRGRPATLAAGDRSVQLLRTAGPREAARAVAAAVAVDPGFGETVFIGADAVLDSALFEFGLPTLGAASSHRASALSELLPMTLGLAWAPVDPVLAHDWLALPSNSLPAHVARRLLASLGRWPAVNNPEWLGVVEELGPANGDVARTLATVFTPLADRSHEIRVRDLLPRVELVEQWALRTAQQSPAHLEVADQARSLRRRFQLADLSRVGPAALDAVLASVSGRGQRTSHEAQAGYGSVGEPGGIVGPARRTIWWSFLASGSQRRAAVPLRAQEREALKAIGVVPAALADEVRNRAARASRPLLHTSGTLLLVAPHHDETGESSHPHALWSELLGRLADPRDARHLHVSEPTFSKPAERASAALVGPAVTDWRHQVSFPLVMRPKESPSSLTKLLGCSFAYAAEYLGQVRTRLPAPPVSDNRLFGQLAHEVFARLAEAGELTGPHAAARALAVLEDLLPSHGALLLLPGHQQELVELRAAVSGSAATLAHFIDAEHLSVHSVEKEISMTAGQAELRGTPDLVLANQAGRLLLLDLKWSGESYRRDELRSGTALQLSAYARLLSEAGLETATLGYFILKSQRMLVRGAAVQQAERVHTDLLAETWEAVERRWTQRSAELARGEVFADGVTAAGHDPVDDATLVQGTLTLPAPCTFCSLGVICGRAL